MGRYGTFVFICFILQVALIPLAGAEDVPAVNKGGGGKYGECFHNG